MTALPLPEEQPTVPLWADDRPCAGRALGLGRASSYEAARRGEIPGLLVFGRRMVVATAALRQALGLAYEDDETRVATTRVPSNSPTVTVTTSKGHPDGTA